MLPIDGITKPRKVRSDKKSGTYYQRHRESIKAARRAFRKEHGAELNSKRRAAYAADERKKAVTWARNIRYKYGLSSAKFDELMVRQDGRCAICHRELIQSKHTGQRLCIDHNHGTGTARGLLCHRCNMFVGYLENIGLRTDALAYLAAHDMAVGDEPGET